MDEYSAVGLHLPDDLIADLDDLAAEWDSREATPISRSTVAREALAVGLVALEVMDDEGLESLSTRERRAIIRQAVLDHFRAEE